MLSDDLKWSKHVDHIQSKANKTIGMLKAASHNMPRQCLEKAYTTVIRPTVEYASPLWDGLSVQDTDRLESIQYHAGRVITGAMKYTPKTNVNAELQLDSLATRRKASSLQIMHRMVNDNVPEHLQTLKPRLRREVHSTGTRNTTNKTLDQPKVRLQCAQNSFIPRTVSLWNRLPLQNTGIDYHYKILNHWHHSNHNTKSNTS